MTKKDIAIRTAQKTGVTQSLVRKVADGVFNEMMEALVRGEGIELRNFGVFTIKSRKARIGRNPRTGEKVSIPPKKKVYFKMGKILKKRMKEAQDV